MELQMFKALKTSRKGNEGFSLVELLVVLLIMSILAGIAVPLYLNQKQRSYLSIAQADATALGQEVTSLVSDYTAFNTGITPPVACAGTIALGTLSCALGTSGTTSAYIVTFGTLVAATGSGLATATGTPTTGSLRISNGSSVSSANYGNGGVVSAAVTNWCLVVANNGAYAKYTNAGLTASGLTALTCVGGL